MVRFFTMITSVSQGGRRNPYETKATSTSLLTGEIVRRFDSLTYLDRKSHVGRWMFLLLTNNFV